VPPVAPTAVGSRHPTSPDMQQPDLA